MHPLRREAWLQSSRRAPMGVMSLALAAGAFLLFTPMFWAAARPAAPLPAEGFQGKFLIAASRMTDPRFHQAVILMVEHDQNGAFGLIVNRRATTTKLSELLSGSSPPFTGEDRDLPVFFGGPVQLEAGFLLHSPEFRTENSRDVVEGVALTSDVEMFQKMGQGVSPARSLLAFGYAGWGPGQLEREIDEGSWYTLQAEASLVFADAPAKTWRSLIDRVGVRI